MKFRKLILCISFVFIMFLCTTNVNASENVKIKSIELIDKSVNTTEVSKATFNGLVMDFDLKFMSLNDYAKYKVVVENKGNVDYKISIDSNFGNSKYIAYDYVKADSLKANSDTEFYVTVSYMNEVNDSDFSNGKYNEKNSAVLKLSDSSISNPVTSNDMILILVSLLVIASVLYVLYSNKKNIKLNVFVLLSLLSIPLFVKAVDSLKITFNSNVVIEKGYSVGYEVGGYIKASDISDYDVSHAELFRTVYAGSVSEENKYLLYDGRIIYKGKKIYAFGETVNFDPDSIDTYDFSFDYNNGNCRDVDEGDISLHDLSDTVVCKSPEKSRNIYSYWYDKNDITYFGYKCNDDDNTVMKFSNARDGWQNYGIIEVYDNSTFIMPNHDVLFTGDDV